jgi:hypothetical protein
MLPGSELALSQIKASTSIGMINSEILTIAITIFLRLHSIIISPYYKNAKMVFYTFLFLIDKGRSYKLTPALYKFLILFD